VMEPTGELIGKLELPGGHARNFAFGGEDYSTLFIAAGSSIFKLETDIPGVPSTPAGTRG
jgi:sugar lactone lactonase YvrE